MTDGCVPCAMEDADPASVVFRDDLWACEVVPGFDVPGWFVLRVRRHALRIVGLTGRELATYGRRARDLVDAVTTVTGAPTTYMLTFSEANPHFHTLVAPRGAEVPPERRLGAILDQRDDRRDPAAALALVPAVAAAYARTADQAVEPDRPAPPRTTARADLPASTQVLVAGGGPVGLATAVELGRRGIHCLVVEPRPEVSRARPRCKTINVRTMEHLRRWGIADRLRERAPLPVSWSQDVVFCTSLTGHELSRFTGVLGLADGGERYPEPGQQAPQYILEDLFREVVGELDACTLATGLSVASLDQQPDEVKVVVTDGTGAATVVTADHVVGADGPRSAVREQIGSAYAGEHALRPNFGVVFHAPDLWSQVRHGPAVQFWTINPEVPSVMGPIDRNGTWWLIAFGVDRDAGERDPLALVHGVAGTDVDATIMSTDPWTARMQLVDSARRGRVFLAGDAAHLNPPFGGHGLNTGIGDAVDLGWKLAATIDGWGGPALLDSYEAERRPIQDRVITEAATNMKVLSTDLLAADLDADNEAGVRARAAAHAQIQATKRAEYHSLDLVLGPGLDGSPVVASGTGGGFRLPHAWLDGGRSLYDELGSGLTLLRLGGSAAAPDPIAAAARARGVPLTTLDLRGLRSRYGCDLLLVRPDQHVVWAGDRAPADAGALVDRVRGA